MFTCAVCQRVLSTAHLSERSLAKAGGSVRDALHDLPDGEILCQECTQPSAPLRGQHRWGADARYFRRLYSGVRLDDATLDWLRQNF